jgi:hypothetical protein
MYYWDKFEKDPSERLASYSSRERQLTISTNFDIELSFLDRNKIKRLNGKEKLAFNLSLWYIFNNLDQLNISGDALWYFRAKLQECFKITERLNSSGQIAGHWPIYWTNNQIIFELEQQLQLDSQSERNFYRFIQTERKFEHNGKLYNLLDYCILILTDTSTIQFKKLNIRKPKKLVRHKGYRDRGSLGSIFASCLREQYRTEEVQKILEAEEQERKRRYQARFNSTSIRDFFDLI